MKILAQLSIYQTLFVIALIIVAVEAAKAVMQ
jgi:hypothetical protein